MVEYIAPSTNTIYAGIHWAKRKRHADDAHLAVKIAAKGVAKFTKPVSLTFQPLINGRTRDTLNNSYWAKLVEDGLVRAGVLEDDSTKWVQPVTIMPVIKADESKMVVTIVEVSDD